MNGDDFRAVSWAACGQGGAVECQDQDYCEDMSESSTSGGGEVRSPEPEGPSLLGCVRQVVQKQITV
jgi:hypothetical protein